MSHPVKLNVVNEAGAPAQKASVFLAQHQCIGEESPGDSDSLPLSCQFPEPEMLLQLLTLQPSQASSNGSE